MPSIEETSTLNKTQQQIFKSIMNIPRSKQEIASALGVSIKTVRNNLPKMGSLLENYNLIHYIGKNEEDLFSITPKKMWMPKIKDKVFTYSKGQTTPYMVVNLPDPPSGKEWVLYPFGDMHFGSNSCDYEKLDEQIDLIASQDNAIVMLMGDLIENSNKDSIAEGVYRQIFPPQEQQEKLISKFAPIANKIILNVLGNHGNRTVKSVYLDPERNICNALEVESFDGMTFVDIICQKHKWEVALLHGTTGSATVGGRINALMKKNVFHSADLYLMGHTHDEQVFSDIELVRNPKLTRLDIKRRSYVLTGGFLKYFGAYPNKSGMSPLPLGVPTISLLCDGSRKPGSLKVTVDNMDYS